MWKRVNSRQCGLSKDLGLSPSWALGFLFTEIIKICSYHKKSKRGMYSIAFIHLKHTEKIRFLSSLICLWHHLLCFPNCNTVSPKCCYFLDNCAALHSKVMCKLYHCRCPEQDGACTKSEHKHWHHIINNSPCHHDYFNLFIYLVSFKTNWNMSITLTPLCIRSFYAVKWSTAFPISLFTVPQMRRKQTKKP